MVKIANVSGLTEKMKHFAREYYNNGGNATEAYLIAYDTTSRTTAQRESSLLLKRADINEYIKALNIPNEIKAISEREKKRSILWEEIENARTQQDHAAVARYMDILNKMDSEYINIQRIEKDETPINDLDTGKLIQLANIAN